MRPPASTGEVPQRCRHGVAWCVLALVPLFRLSRAATLDVHVLTADGHTLSGAVVTVQSLAMLHHV